jgi:hypothetical protein
MAEEDSVSAIPQNPFLGLVASALSGTRSAAQFLQDLGVQTGMPTPYMIGRAVEGLLGNKPEMAADASYGFPPTKGAGLATQIKPEYAPDAADLMPGPGAIEGLVGKALAAKTATGSLAMFLPARLLLPQSTRNEALSLAKEGAAPAEIWAATKMWKLPDKQWVTEIPDASAGPVRQFSSLPDKAQPPFYPLQDFFQHPELEKVMPGIERTRSTLWRGTGEGAYMPGSLPQQFGILKASGADPNELRNSTLHEIQHAVADVTGLPAGANDEQWASVAGKHGDVMYTGDLGEALARLVERRSTLNEAQQQAKPPWLNSDAFRVHTMTPSEWNGKADWHLWPDLPDRFKNLAPDEPIRMFLEDLFSK